MRENRKARRTQGRRSKQQPLRRISDDGSGGCIVLLLTAWWIARAVPAALRWISYHIAPFLLAAIAVVALLFAGYGMRRLKRNRQRLYGQIELAFSAMIA